MSGRKCSKFQLRQEREQKLRLIQNLGNLHAEITGLKQHCASLLKNASAGLRSTFANEVRGAERWLNETSIPDVSGLDMEAALDLINKTNAQLENTAAEGRKLQELLTVTFTQKADELGQRLTKRLAEVERLYISRRQLLQDWFGEEGTQVYQRDLREAQRLLDSERYAELEQSLAQSEKEITAQSRSAAEQEEKHQKRIYLRDALRQVCAQMGFEEVVKPHFEREGERGSNIIFMVDTFDQGEIKFTLALDSITSDSGLEDKWCPTEFGKLSEHLEAEFGIQTQFRTADGEPLSDLIQKGELHPPYGVRQGEMRK